MRIAWLNNVQAPYREPMFVELARLVDLEVGFFARRERFRNFVWRPHPGYPSSVLPSVPLPLPPAVRRRLGEEVGLLRPGVVGRFLRATDALVVQVWWQPATLHGILAARRRRIPYLIYAESTMASRSVKNGPADALRSWVFRNAGAVLVPGPSAAAAALTNGTPASRIVETVNSVDVEIYGPRVRALRAHTPTEGPHRFACIGQLIERKNVHSLLRALAATGGDAVLEIVGDGVDKSALQALAMELGIADRVRFLGFLQPQDVLEVLARCHTLALPSTDEVYGYTALEAHVAGLRVIVSDRCGIASNLRGRCGVDVTEPDVPALTAALRRAVADGPRWFDDTDTWFASPRRAAEDVVSAVRLTTRPQPTTTSGS
ncbi:glycosyltransferase [Pseudonocardia phyllosphaerae]|uniref:glycosyltransferase n=1 Tax=Pseudonocardia phyllosphaerae TaxID=3390502 RepID=UPI00397AD850